MEYKRIKNFKNYYVGSDGNMYKDCGGARGLKRLKGMPNSGGYRAVVMVENGYKERYLIHRLVAMYFLPNPDNKPYVDHIDGDKLNNAVDNLRWATPKENSNNPLTLETMKVTQRELRKTPIVCKKDGMEFRFDDQYIAGQYFNCDCHHILEAANTNKQLYGFQVFKVKKDEKQAS